MRANTVAAALGIALLAACAKGDKTGADSARTSDTAAAPATTGSAPSPTLTDGNIAAVLDELNAADSAFGKTASTKGTSKDVKEFGALMMRDHHALRKAGQDLVTKIGVTPTPPSNDSLPMKVKTISDSLNALAKGAAFDKGYIADEVANHRSVLAFIDNALSATHNADVKGLLSKARPNVQMHLTRAQDIQSKIGSPATH